MPRLAKRRNGSGGQGMTRRLTKKACVRSVFLSSSRSAKVQPLRWVREAPEGGEQRAHGGVEFGEGIRVLVTIHIAADGQAHIAPAHQQAIIPGEAVVVYQIACVFYPLASAPTPLSQMLGAQRLSEHDVGERGNLLAAQHGNEMRVRVGGQGELPGRDLALRGVNEQPARAAFDGGARRVLEHL